jgi:hypothetical protein
VKVGDVYTRSWAVNKYWQVESIYSDGSVASKSISKFWFKIKCIMGRRIDER